MSWSDWFGGKKAAPQPTGAPPPPPPHVPPGQIVFPEGVPITQWPATNEFMNLGVSMIMLDVPEDGFYVEVVGEFSYQGTIGRIAGGKTENGALKPDHLAVLLPEPTNVYDKNAVRVYMEGGLVGYLSREDAVAYRPAIDHLASGGQVVGARGAITGGWDRGKDDRGSFGVQLYMGDPDDVMAEVTAE